MSIDNDLTVYSNYAQAGRKYSSVSILNALLLKLINISSGGDVNLDVDLDSVIGILNDIVNVLNSNNVFLGEIKGEGTISPPLTGTATEVESTVLSSDSTRSWIYITNLSKTDYLYVCFGLQATILNSIIIAPTQTYYDFPIALVTESVSLITEAGKNINYCIRTISN